jgi:hypothetical protein
MRFLQQLGMVLRAILAQRWLAAALAFFLILPLLTSSRLFNGSNSVRELSIIERPPASAYDGSEAIPPDQLAKTRDLDLRTRDIRAGNWQTIGRVPALERLWVEFALLSEEGWQWIGEHPTLELLSLRYAVRGRGEDERVAREGRDALARLTRLRSLKLREEGTTQGVLLPTLPALEACQLGSAHLEANLRTLADGSPALRTLAVATGGDTPLTPAMVASLRNMPHLRAVYVVALNQRNMIEIDEPSTRRQVADLAAALPRIRVRSGVCVSNLADRVFWAAVAWPLLVSCLFWFGAGTLLATPLGWMLPDRLAAHLFWPITASILACAPCVTLCQQLGVNWLPAVALAATAVAVASFGLQYIFCVFFIDTAIRLVFPNDRIERWLIDGEPVPATGLLIVATAVIAMRLRRLAEMPRILAKQGREVPFGLVTDWSQVKPAERRWQWPAIVRGLSEGAAIDRQIAKQSPASIAAAAGFATMLRRPQSRLSGLLVAGSALVLPWVISFVSLPDGGGRVRQVLQFGFANLAAALLLIGITKAWFQWSGNAAIEFLRPVSRPAFWQGLRQAITRDLIAPAALVAYSLVVGLWTDAGGTWLPWFLAMLGFLGFVALAQATAIVAATSRRMVTLVIVVAGACAAYVAMHSSIAMAIDEVHGRMVGRRLDPTLMAAAVLAAGLAIRAAVLWKLEDREIA